MNQTLFLFFVVLKQASTETDPLEVGVVCVGLGSQHILVVVVTDIGLASVLIDLFITVEEVGAVVARTRKTGTS